MKKVGGLQKMHINMCTVDPVGNCNFLILFTVNWQLAVLYKRLIWRGWDQEFLKKLFLSSYEWVKSTATSRAELAANLGPVEQEDYRRKRLFFHIEYHPCDLPRRQIRQLYDQVCKDTFETDVGITEFTVAYKRPTNIYDSVVKTKLYEVEGKSVSYYIGEANGNWSLPFFFLFSCSLRYLAR